MSNKSRRTEPNLQLTECFKSAKRFQTRRLNNKRIQLGGNKNRPIQIKLSKCRYSILFDQRRRIHHLQFCQERTSS